MHIYHKELGFPKTIQIPKNTLNVGYTVHARERRKGRIGGFMVAPRLLKLTENNLIEIHTEDNIHIKKALVRTYYDKYQDLTMILELREDQNKVSVITLFLNKRTEKHTVDKTKYVLP